MLTIANRDSGFEARGSSLEHLRLAKLHKIQQKAKACAGLQPKYVFLVFSNTELVKSKVWFLIFPWCLKVIAVVTVAFTTLLGLSINRSR